MRILIKLFELTLFYESKTIFKLSALLNVAKAAKIWVNVRQIPKYLNKKAPLKQLFYINGSYAKIKPSCKQGLSFQFSILNLNFPVISAFHLKA